MAEQATKSKIQPEKRGLRVKEFCAMAPMSRSTFQHLAKTGTRRFNSEPTAVETIAEQTGISSQTARRELSPPECDAQTTRMAALLVKRGKKAAKGAGVGGGCPKKTSDGSSEVSKPTPEPTAVEEVAQQTGHQRQDRRSSHQVCCEGCKDERRRRGETDRRPANLFQMPGRHLNS